jgi:hypothetical protein
MTTALEQVRTFRMQVRFVPRSEDQTEGARGDANVKKTWSCRAAWRMYIGGVDDVATAKELSEACSIYMGQASILGLFIRAPVQINGPGRTQGAIGGLSRQHWRRITSDELCTGLRPDEARVLFKNQNPGHFGTPFWVRDEMLADPKPNPILTEPHVGAT